MQRGAHFRLKYVGKLDGVSYLEKTWTPHEAKFMRARPDKVMHFTNTSMSAIGRAHSALKRYLQTSAENMDLVQARMKQATDHQFRKLGANISSERIQIPHAFRGSVSYEQLVRGFEEFV